MKPICAYSFIYIHIPRAKKSQFAGKQVFACYIVPGAEFKIHTVHSFPNKHVKEFALF